MNLPPDGEDVLTSLFRVIPLAFIIIFQSPTHLDDTLNHDIQDHSFTNGAN